MGMGAPIARSPQASTPAQGGKGGGTPMPAQGGKGGKPMPTQGGKGGGYPQQPLVPPQGGKAQLTPEQQAALGPYINLERPMPLVQQPANPYTDNVAALQQRQQMEQQRRQQEMIMRMPPRLRQRYMQQGMPQPSNLGLGGLLGGFR